MTTSVGGLDRTWRIIVGLVLIAYAVSIGFPSTSWNWVGWICVIPLLNSHVGYRPFYVIVGVSTCPRK